MRRNHDDCEDLTSVPLRMYLSRGVAALTVRNLNRLFRPSSVALVGASEREGSLGRILLSNLLEHFSGPVYPVNPKATTLLGVTAYQSVEQLPASPDFALIATPPETVPGVVAALAERDCLGVCIITAGFGGDSQGKARRQAILDAAKPKLVRIVGPNCVGLQIPGIGLNASFASVFPKAGSIAFVAQSGAVITAVLDWAYPRGIGFSIVASLGDMADVDFGDMLDYLAADPGTSAVLLYIESITQPRKFLSAARAAARSKPVIVVKAGREPAGAQAAASHTGALAGIDAVYDAAFERAGMLRVLTLEELFDMAETLATAKIPNSEALTIVTNGGGLGVLAADALAAEGGRLSSLSEETIAALNEVLPFNWSHSNPIDIIGDATGTRYADALKVLLQAQATDAILVLNCPTALASSDEVAGAVIDTLPTDDCRTVLASWTGEHSTRGPRERLQRHGIPTYDTPEDAVHAFMQLVRYRRNQQVLKQIPPAVPDTFEADAKGAEHIVSGALKAGRQWLNEVEAKALLSCYGIPTVPTRMATTPDQVSAVAQTLEGPLAIKILSPDITHKSDVGGVLLNVRSAHAKAAAEGMFERVQARCPQARLHGFSVQPMVDRTGAQELILGMINDAQFGPVILFGHGGVAVEVINDRALALPPLNIELALDLMSRTRVAKLLHGYRDVPAADLDEIAKTLVKLSHLIADQPAVEELDINPLLADARGVVALDARVRVLRPATVGSQRLAIRPYPKELEMQIELPDGSSLFLRPVMPEDENALHEAFTEMNAAQAARLTQIDYDRQMVLVATERDSVGSLDISAYAHLQEDPDRTQARVNIAVAPAYRGHHLRNTLRQTIREYARQRGIGEVIQVDLDA